MKKLVLYTLSLITALVIIISPILPLCNPTYTYSINEASNTVASLWEEETVDPSGRDD